MTPEDIGLIRHCLPDEMAFPYYADRESAWLLANLMPGDDTVTALKQGSAAKLLTRPVLRPLAAATGGALAQRDVLALAHADRAMAWDGLSRAAEAALEQLYGGDWLDFRLSLSSWGEGADWQWNQLSRKGGNLVLQLGFPSEHTALMGQYLPRESRKDFECAWHPVRQGGCPTLAWARLDVDLATGTALIEELQSDWLRILRRRIDVMAQHTPRARELKQRQTYEAKLRDRYDRLWPKAMLLAVLMLLRDELGCRDVYLHQPGPGAALKNIYGRHPPRSLYTTLPRSFCFEATRDVPHFLARNRILRKLARRPDPLFWRLAL
ncbi:hypothetical protein EI983_00430 [Roseovarius faecimaris]|uniref:Uncharacterized protein n=1 Tax=Roseovarius faecimaris TaxID=2494550 RepID=A0A6I6IJN9_9RHOB|nr:hypothetical protein [Roseovarius faecimaris]QGX96825.1 hypothetical protein EI983_00430 [Roseovarius faecimaris]